MVLEIVLADHAGFCFGVKRATELAISLAEESNKPLYTLGPLIHNPQVVKRLGDLGVHSIEDLNDLSEGIVLIRSHGVPPHVIDEIKEKGLEVVDATCPYVKRAQEYAKKLAQDGYQVIICGDQNHPEVIGIVGSVKDEALVVKSVEELENHKLRRKVGVIAQTTLSIKTFQDVISRILELAKEIKVFNTICTTTEEKQKAASNLAKKVEVMLVIGGRNSANTNRLAEICRAEGVTTYHIETAAELKDDWFRGVEKVGVTAGASTPNWIIKEVLTVMSEEKKEVLTEDINPGEEEVKEEVEVNEAEETVEVETEETVEESTNQQEMMLDHSIRPLRKGERIKGTVVQVKDDSVYVSIGYKSDGIITLDELTNKPDIKSAKEVVEEGDEIEVLVLNLEDEEGNVQLSRKRLAREEAWERVEEAHKNGEIIEAEVDRVVKGGLVIFYYGLRGFVPASHAAIEYIENLDQFVGQTLRLKVIEVDRSNNNVVLSRKVVLEAEREAQKAETMEKLEEGQVVEGKVTKLVDFGAFVDLGGIEGLLHISEMSWGRIDHPSEVLEEGETIKVKVLKLDLDKERIALGLKQILPDPWEEFIEKHHVGEVVTGTITKTVDFGAFMEIEPGIEGLIHISQLARRHVEKPTEVVNVNDKVEAKIININEDERKVGLSIKELEPAPAPKPKQHNKKRAKKEPETYSTAPQESSGFSIGEMIGDLFDDKK